MNALLRLGQTRLWFLGFAAGYAFLLAAYADLAPFYDGGIYYASIRRLITEPFRWELLHMEGHPSPVYTLLMAWSQFISEGAAVPMFVTNMALALFAAWTFYKLIGLLCRNATETERMIGAGIYAFMPVFVVHLFHVNLDVGLSFFYVPFLYFLLKGRPWLAVLFASAMMLTKETGVLVYVLTAAAYLTVYVLRTSRSPGKALREALNRWQLAVPAAVFGLYYGSYRLFSPQTLGHWGEDRVSNASVYFDFNLAQSDLQAFVFNLYGLNFNWLLSLAIAAYATRALWRWSFGLPQKRSAATRAADALFLFLLLAGITYVTTRVRPWNNARYMLVGYPVLIALAHHCLTELVASARVRESLMSIALSLMLVANVTTIDPVSRAFYGTIPFGKHAWLNMTSRLGPEWLRRDPQAYNLEFFELHYAARAAFARIRPPAGAVVAAGPAADFFFSNNLEPETYNPTLRIEGMIPVWVLDLPEEMTPDRLPALLPAAQENVWYLALPNLDNAQFLPAFMANYTLLSSEAVGRRGYEVMLHTFVRP